MLPYICISVGIILYSVLSYVLVRRAHMVQNGTVKELYGDHGGLGEVYVAFFRVYKNIARSSAVLKRLAFQYIFHILVRVLYHVKAFTNGAYAFARNQFVKNAVKSKSSVSFFWTHLKEYKKQIEKEGGEK